MIKSVQEGLVVITHKVEYASITTHPSPMQIPPAGHHPIQKRFEVERVDVTLGHNVEHRDILVLWRSKEGQREREAANLAFLTGEKLMKFSWGNLFSLFRDFHSPGPPAPCSNPAKTVCLTQVRGYYIASTVEHA